MTVTITTGVSTTVKSAQSKKCRLLAKVAAGTCHPKVAKAIRAADPMLADCMTEAEIDRAATEGTRPGRGGSKAGTVLTIEID